MFSKFLLTIAIPLVSLTVQAGEIGTLTVTEAFTIKPWTRLGSVNTSGKPMVVQPGSYRVKIGFDYYGKSSKCVDNWIRCDIDKDYKNPYQTITFFDKNGRVIRRIGFKHVSSMIDPNNYEKGSRSAGAKAGQSFNIFERSSWTEEKVNYHWVGGNYCEVDMWRTSGGWRSETTSAIGEKSIRYYDEVRTTVTTTKFTNMANETIASMREVSTSKSTDQVDKEGECKLNKNHKDN